MSAHRQQRTRERPRYPEVEHEIGEDPARFLATHDPESLDSGPGDSPELALAMARIHGIRSESVVDAWVGVEADLTQGPRKPVIAALNRRKTVLQKDAA